MGARKGKNCKTNIFIINGIIHDVCKSKRKKPVVLQIYDYAQMFDSINLKKAVSDVSDAGLKDDNLVLLHEANKQVNMAVNTPSGISERQIIKNNVLQGDTWGSLMASVQVDTIGQACVDAGYGYKYKDSVMVTLLGMVDDMLGVTEAGYQAQQMNALINIKTAEKGLQFGITKCKSMIVGKDTENVLFSDLTVDKWSTSHRDDPETGEEVLQEVYEGPVTIDRTDQQKYLGFVLSSKGDNMVNINQMKNKSKGIIRRIFSKLNSLNLQRYYLECAMIFMNTMLRSSILYACETYYNLKEVEIRQLERIEEGFLRELLKTSKGCPITQIYLELGQAPARFEIMKIRLLFLKHILNQSKDSLVSKFLDAQLKTSAKGDWIYMCMENLKFLKIYESFEEIEKMSCYTFKKLLNERIKKTAFIYLTDKQGFKGGEIQYSDLQMSEYLSPCSKDLAIEVKQKIFAMRNMMINIPANFSSSKIHFKCVCGEKEDMNHIYECKMLNRDEPLTEYSSIYTNNIDLIKVVHKRFEQNIEKREQIMEKNEKKIEQKEKEKLSPPVIHTSDPLYAVYSKG